MQSSGGSPLDFIQYGILGLVIAALLLGWLWAKPAVDRLIADKEKAEEQRNDLLKVYEEKIMPALIQSTSVTTSLIPVMEEVIRCVDDIRASGVLAKKPPARRSSSAKP